LKLVVLGGLGFELKSIVLLEGLNSSDKHVMHVVILLGKRVSKILDVDTKISSLRSNGDIWRKSNDISLVLEDLFWLQKPNKVLDQTDLLLERALLLDCSNCSEGVAHDGDKHVHEYHQKEDSSCDEDEPDDKYVIPLVSILAVSIVAKFTHSNKVCSNDGINDL